MKLDIKALGFTISVLTGGSILTVGLCNLIWSGYAQNFLDLAASVYPGYQGTASLGQVIIVTLYGMADGFFGGVIFAWLYNFFRPAAQ